ncbi:MAG TPA: FtsX-like permease family protein [Blastocatellia bacterium]|nr:FtsX-like permease family protein [Blastocatellia bacterium]
MLSHWTVFRQFILRALAREKLRAGITALGICLGVAVVIAIRLANASSLESFRAATNSMAGDTSIQITGTAGRFDEMLLAELGWLSDYGKVSPVIAGYAMTDPQGGRSSPLPSPESGGDAWSSPGASDSFAPTGEFIQVLGVDVLRDRPLRQFRLVRVRDDDSQPTPRELLLLLTDPNSILLTEKFARARGLTLGAGFPLIIGDRRREFVVRGLLLDEGPARALQGNFALMDIAAAQLAFNRLGTVDRVDVKLKNGLRIEAAEDEIRRKLPQSLTITRPEAGYREVEKMIAAFHFNLNALGSIALLVGLFLIYNTVSISVITRREEVGALRAVGASRRLILALFLGEAALLAIVGTIAGLGLGKLMAGVAVRATAATVETFYIATAATQIIATSTLGATEILMAFSIALTLAIVAASVPAVEASRVRPVEAMRGARRIAQSVAPPRKLLLVSLTLIAFAYALSRLDPIAGLPLFGFAAAGALMFAGAFLTPAALWIGCALGERVIGGLLRLFKVEAKLAGANLRGAIPRVSISVAALGVALAMMVAVSILIGSFRKTVSYWVDESMVADIYARPMMRTATSYEGEIADELVAAVTADPAVEAVYPFTTHQVSLEGNLLTVGAGDFATFLNHGRLLFKSPRDARERMHAAMGRDAVSVNESFALRFNKEVGDTIELPTMHGSKPFEIATIYYDYATSRGWVVMDQATYARHFHESRPGSLSIYLKSGADAEQVKERLTREAGIHHPTFFTTNSSLRREVMRIFDSTFAITRALELIAITVAGLGVISTLIALILERRREIAMLGFIGATRAQIKRMIVIEALMIGAVGQGIGIAVGAMLSLILIYVINVQSFGWTIQFHFPLAFLVESSLLILAASALAALYPAARAVKIKAAQFAREE